MNKLLINIMLILSVYACGGDAEDDIQPKTEIITEVVEKAITTADLVASEGFDFITDYEVDIKLAMSPANGIQYYINICSDYKNDKENVVINYNSCKLRTFLTSEEQHYTLLISAAETNLIAQIWPMENNAQAHNFYWNKSSNNTPWFISL